MKTGWCRVLALLLAALLTQGCAAFAEPGGDPFEYRLLEDGSAMITGYKGSDPDPVFPETAGGCTVRGLSKSFGANTPAVSDLRSITLPDTMTEIEPGALQFAASLTEIRFTGEHPVLAFEDGALYNREKQSLLLYLRSNTAEAFEVPDGIREVEDKAFYRTNVVSVRFPGSVERIGRSCFDQCPVLAEVTLSEGLQTIGTEAFMNCDRLKRIRIPASVTGIEEGAFTDNRLQEIETAPGSEVFAVSDGALINLRDGVLIAWPTQAGAESCTVPEGVVRIGQFAFYRCHRLKQITFPEGLQEIGRGAMISCDHLTAIDLPDSVVRLEASAFEGNSDAETLRLPAGLTEIVNNFDGAGITALEIPDSVTVIEGSFRSLPNLTEAVIPDSVRSLSGNSFAFCRKLAGMTIPAGVTELGCTFTGCAETLVIRTEAGSAAEQYCTDRGLHCEIIPE